MADIDTDTDTDTDAVTDIKERKFETDPSVVALRTQQAIRQRRAETSSYAARKARMRREAQAAEERKLNSQVKSVEPLKPVS